MCSSATANFAGSAVLGVIGVATIREVEHERELLFGCVPLLFAVHQFTEGFVWLGLDGRLSPTVAHDAGAAFMLYAQGLLPLLLPLSILLFEPTVNRRRLMLPFAALGWALTLYVLWALAAYPTQMSVEQNGIVYQNVATNHTWIAILYVISTCGALFFSKVKNMVLFGAADLGILLVTLAVRRYAFASVWCAYTAIDSVIIWAGFRSSNADRPYAYPSVESGTRVPVL